MTGRTVDDLFDEVFDDPDSVDAAHGGIPDPLLAELERSRTGEMRDIVATIQAEQDVVIRAPLDTCLVVQGGPGTGKTAVGLHRAAFLLYEHREQLDRDGRARRRPEPDVPALHRAGPPVAGRGGDPPDHDRAPRRRPRAVGSRRAATGPAQGRRPHWRGSCARAPASSSRPPDGRRRGRHGVGPAAPRRPTALAAAVDEIAARDVPFTVGRTAFRTRLAPARLAAATRLALARTPPRPAVFDAEPARQHRRSTPRSPGSGRRCRRPAW